MNPRQLSISVPIALLVALSGAAGCGLWDTIEARQLAREGNTLYKQAEYARAIEKYLEAKERDPETPNLYLNLGYAYFSMYDRGEDDTAAAKAIRAFEQHLERVPGDEEVQVFLIKTLLRAAPSDKAMADRALAAFTQMLEANPKDHEARQYLITLFIDCQRYDDAVAFFASQLEQEPDIETMKILAIIADKSKRTQQAVDWYWKRAETTADPDKKAVLFYEVGTYAWNLLHYQPGRHTGVEAIKLADQGIEACRRAMRLKDKYAEAMVYANLLYLKRAIAETDEQSRLIDQRQAFELRKEAGLILLERKKEKRSAEAGEAEKREESG
ncbi:MAG: tetratricopeptide repeat protein [Deltaproteobacteria bacterium]|nr:tetratricopeptide repeat protein [Deltaproteobacteria bacterium]